MVGDAKIRYVRSDASKWYMLMLLHAEAFCDLGLPAIVQGRPQRFYQKHFQNAAVQRQWPLSRPSLWKTTLAAKERCWCRWRLRHTRM